MAEALSGNDRRIEKTLKDKVRQLMELQFKNLDSGALKTLAPHFTFRENKTCDSGF